LEKFLSACGGPPYISEYTSVEWFLILEGNFRLSFETFLVFDGTLGPVLRPIL
jgi:hypothetical protein